jgi:NAD(P)-dependent dehydrogenase (short-subunit alcohol dehydrogenase family)
MRLEGKVAIITGGNSGIGRSTALLFSQEGATVVVGARNQARGEAVVEEIVSSGGKAQFIATDVADASQVENLVASTMAAYRRLDLLVNNAGTGPFKKITDTTLSDWDHIMDVNLKGIYLMSKAAIPQMQRQGGGNIINVASQLGLVGDSDHAAYCASKGGVIQLTRALAIDHAGDQIRVNCVCPGPIWTPMIEHQFEHAPDPEDEQRRIEDKMPLRRLGRPEEIASVILFLACEDSSYMTGAVVAVDGGWTAQ